MKSMARLSLLCPFLFPLLAVACGGGSSPSDEVSSRQESPLLNAPIDSTHTFSVGVCGGPVNQDADAGPVGTCLVPGRRCTGTLVAPNLVLTARHCVQTPGASNPVFCNNTFQGSIATASVTLSSSTIEGSPVWLNVRETRVPSDDNTCNNDLALLILEHDVPGCKATPASIDVDTDIAITPPKAIIIVGRGGIRETFDPDAGTDTVDKGGYERRILQNIPLNCVSNVDGTCVVTDTSSPPSNQFALPKALALFGPAMAPGDSGAGFLDQASFNRGRPTVIAVGSLVTYGFDGHGDSSIGGRVSLHKDFLIEGAVHAAQLGGYPVPKWAH